jgi:hypothetical protein
MWSALIRQRGTIGDVLHAAVMDIVAIYSTPMMVKSLMCSLMIKQNITSGLMTSLL